jgi:hypothetical protein
VPWMLRLMATAGAIQYWTPRSPNNEGRRGVLQVVKLQR